MERYAKYVRDNPELAKSLPSLVPVLVCLLPARQSGGGGPEVIAEAGYALSNLWSLLHEHLLHERGPDGETGLAAFRSAPVQTKARVILTVISCTELLMEKWSRQHAGPGGRGPRRLIVVLEALKLLLRLVILAKTEDGMLLHGGRYLLAGGADPESPLLQADEHAPPRGQRVRDGTSGRHEHEQLLFGGGGGHRSMWDPPVPYVETKGRRMGRRFLTCRQVEQQPTAREGQQALAQDGRHEGSTAAADAQQPQPKPAEQALQLASGSDRPATASGEATVTTSAAKEEAEVEEEAVQVARRLQRLRAAGEVLRLVRPLIQASWGGSSGEGAGGASWRPLLLSLLVDVVSLSCSAESLQGDPDPVKRRELERRRLLLLLYLLRPPVYHSTTDPVLSRLMAAASRVPLVGWLSGYVMSSVQYVQKHHFYTVGS